VDTKKITRINRLISDHSDNALDEISSLADLRVHDEHMQTPLNTAIRSHNLPAFEHLTRSKEAINYTPELDKDLKKLIHQVVSEHCEDTIEKTEKFLARTVKRPVHWMRAPLLEACRHQNRFAISTLIEKGARLGTIDAIGYSALELCLETGDGELVQFFIDTCKRHNKKFSVNADLLEKLASKPAIYQEIIQHGTLGATAKKVAFNLACALLDLDTVNRMLSEGHDVNKSVVWNCGPLEEAVTSHLAWLYKHPESTSVAAAFHRVYGQGESPFIMNGSDIDKVIAEMEETFNDEETDNDIEENLSDKDWDAHFEKQVSDMVEATRPGDINPKPQPNGLIVQRLQLIDLLLDHGFDVGKAYPDGGQELLANVILANEPRLLKKLMDAGLRFEPEPEDDNIVHAIQNGCFDMVEPLLELGNALPEVESHWATAHHQYQEWCAQRKNHS